MWEEAWVRVTCFVSCIPTGTHGRVREASPGEHMGGVNGRVREASPDEHVIHHRRDREGLSDPKEDERRAEQRTGERVR